MEKFYCYATINIRVLEVGEETRRNSDLSVKYNKSRVLPMRKEKICYFIIT